MTEDEVLNQNQPPYHHNRKGQPELSPHNLEVKYRKEAIAEARLQAENEQLRRQVRQLQQALNHATLVEKRRVQDRNNEDTACNDQAKFITKASNVVSPLHHEEILNCPANEMEYGASEPNAPLPSHDACGIKHRKSPSQPVRCCDSTTRALVEAGKVPSIDDIDIECEPLVALPASNTSSSGTCQVTPQCQSFYAAVRDRAGWLVGLLILQSMSSFIISRNETMLKQHLVIVQFLTMLVGAGGNGGNQCKSG